MATTNMLEILLDKFPDKNWNWNALSKNLNMTYKILTKYIDKFSASGSWYHISQQKYITWEIYLKEKNNIKFKFNDCNIL